MEDLGDDDEAPTGFRSQWIMPVLLRNWRDCTREMAWLLSREAPSPLYSLSCNTSYRFFLEGLHIQTIHKA